MKSYSTFSICFIYLIFVPLNPPFKIRAKDIVLKVLENFQTSTYPVKKRHRQSNYPDKNILKRCFSSFTIQFSSKSFKKFHESNQKSVKIQKITLRTRQILFPSLLYDIGALSHKAISKCT